jgi:hypothetical protein
MCTIIDGGEIADFIAHQIPVLSYEETLKAERTIEAFLSGKEWPGRGGNLSEPWSNFPQRKPEHEDK